MKHLARNLVTVLAVTGMCLALPGTVAAQEVGSLLNSNIECSELKLTLEKLLLENRQLHESLAKTEASFNEMRSGLAASSGEAEIFKRRSSELKLRIEALGLQTQSKGGEKLEQRLLAAVGDLRVLTEENKKLSEALIRLSEAAALYVQTSVPSDPQTRSQLESEVRNSNSALGTTSLAAAKEQLQPSEGRAISVKEDLALVVLNQGSKKGVKLGMPFDVWRNDRLIGNVRVVDVREKISGAIIQNLSSEKEPIKVGDYLRVATQP